MVGFKSPNHPPAKEPICMHAIATSCRHQQDRINRYRHQSDGYRFFNILTSDALLAKVEALLPEHRERLYPPTETLSLYLAQAMNADHSCKQIVNQFAIGRIAEGLSACSTATGAYCRARARLPEAMVADLARYLGDLIDQQVPLAWRWQGRRVRIVDGTTLSMPDTPENQRDFPQQGGQKPGLGFPICRLVGITCLSSGVLVNAATGRFQGKGGDEKTLLRSLQDTFTSGDIILADAFFATYFFIAAMQVKGVDIVMMQHGTRKKSTDFRRGRRLGGRDHVIVINKPKIQPGWMSEAEYDAAPSTLTIREFKAGKHIMVTTLLCEKDVTKTALTALYKSRWNVELDIRNIKETMSMGILRSKTPAMVKKEIWVYLLAYNLIRLMMAQSAELADIAPRTISFKHCIQLWVASKLHIDTTNATQLRAMFLLMAQQRVADRPGRIEPRARKRRPKPYPLLTRPRHQAREQVRKYGHPKKLK
jgi:hypothetical protein